MDTPTPTEAEAPIITDEFIASAVVPTVRVEPVVAEFRCVNESCQAPLNPGKAGRKCVACRQSA